MRGNGASHAQRTTAEQIYPTRPIRFIVLQAAGGNGEIGAAGKQPETQQHCHHRRRRSRHIHQGRNYQSDARRKSGRRAPRPISLRADCAANTNGIMLFHPRT